MRAFIKESGMLHPGHACHATICAEQKQKQTRLPSCNVVGHTDAGCKITYVTVHSSGCTLPIVGLLTMQRVNLFESCPKLKNRRASFVSPPTEGDTMMS